MWRWRNPHLPLPSPLLLLLWKLQHHKMYDALQRVICVSGVPLPWIDFKQIGRTIRVWVLRLWPAPLHNLAFPLRALLLHEAMWLKPLWEAQHSHPLFPRARSLHQQHPQRQQRHHPPLRVGPLPTPLSAPA